MALPTVTVICLCYNQSRFVREAITSVINQSYARIQLIVVDDASTDSSAAVIRDCIRDFPEVEFLPLTRNVGNCRAFNLALKHAKGDYIVDLAADDVLLEDRVSEGVKALGAMDSRYGVQFSDAYWMDEQGNILYAHSARFPHETIPQGDIYRDLVERFFICSPTVMFKTEVINALGGYDETLSYEDFDFWIRSSRSYLYCYSPEILVKKRIVKNSLSQRQFRFFSPQLESTFRVCEKILMLNHSVEEQQALSRRIFYEMRVCTRLLHIPLLVKYVGLWMRNRKMKY